MDIFFEVADILNTKPHQTYAETPSAKFKVGTVTPQLPDEKSFSQSGASSDPNRLTRNKSLIRKQLMSPSPYRSSQQDSSKANSTLFVSSANVRQSNEKNLADNYLATEEAMLEDVNNQDMENLAISKLNLAVKFEIGLKI